MKVSITGENTTDDLTVINRGEQTGREITREFIDAGIHDYFDEENNLLKMSRTDFEYWKKAAVQYRKFYDFCRENRISPQQVENIRTYRTGYDDSTDVSEYYRNAFYKAAELNKDVLHASFAEGTTGNRAYIIDDGHASRLSILISDRNDVPLYFHRFTISASDRNEPESVVKSDRTLFDMCCLVDKPLSLAGLPENQVTGYRFFKQAYSENQFPYRFFKCFEYTKDGGWHSFVKHNELLEKERSFIENNGNRCPMSFSRYRIAVLKNRSNSDNHIPPFSYHLNVYSPYRNLGSDERGCIEQLASTCSLTVESSDPSSRDSWSEVSEGNGGLFYNHDTKHLYVMSRSGLLRWNDRQEENRAKQIFDPKESRIEFGNESVTVAVKNDLPAIDIISSVPFGRHGKPDEDDWKKLRENIRSGISGTEYSDKHLLISYRQGPVDADPVLAVIKKHPLTRSYGFLSYPLFKSRIREQIETGHEILPASKYVLASFNPSDRTIINNLLTFDGASDKDKTLTVLNDIAEGKDVTCCPQVLHSTGKEKTQNIER